MLPILGRVRSAQRDEATEKAGRAGEIAGGVRRRAPPCASLAHCATWREHGKLCGRHTQESRFHTREPRSVHGQAYMAKKPSEILEEQKSRKRTMVSVLPSIKALTKPYCYNSHDGFVCTRYLNPRPRPARVLPAVVRCPQHAALQRRRVPRLVLALRLPGVRGVRQDELQLYAAYAVQIMNIVHMSCPAVRKAWDHWCTASMTGRKGSNVA